jgi:hypothetical protein
MDADLKLIEMPDGQIWQCVGFGSERLTRAPVRLTSSAGEASAETATPTRSARGATFTGAIASEHGRPGDLENFLTSRTTRRDRPASLDGGRIQPHAFAVDPPLVPTR